MNIFSKLKLCMLRFAAFFISIAYANEAALPPLVLPELVGFATSAYQNCGMEPYTELNAHSNWSMFELTRAAHKGEPTVHTAHTILSGHGTNFIHALNEHIRMIKEIGGNTLRLSFDWTVFEPHCGQFNEKAFKEAEKAIDVLRAAQIEPMISIHHFVHPFWFEQKGGFEKRKNNKYLVRFAKKLFKRLHKKVTLWCTINEINAYVFQGYCQGVFPPCKHNPWHAAKVMRNMLEAHCMIYRALKKRDTTGQCQIGFVHNYLTFKSYKSIASNTLLAPYNAVEQLPCVFLNYIFNDVILHFLKTGELFPYNPLLKKTIIDAPHCYDFMGVNYYSRVLIKSQVMHALSKKDLSLMAIPTGLVDEPLTDMPFALSPRGFRAALLEAATLGVPLYITENGIPDATDEKRAAHLHAHLAIVSEALKSGINIKGYYHWTLVDNFEWDHGYDKQFGMFAYDRTTGAYYPKQSAFVFKRIIEMSALCHPATRAHTAQYE